jgi:hypothetical protein
MMTDEDEAKEFLERWRKTHSIKGNKKRSAKTMLRYGLPQVKHSTDDNLVELMVAFKKWLCRPAVFGSATSGPI